MKKFALLGILLCSLAAVPSFAQYVRVAPPPVVVERPGPPPRPGYVWVPGYHRWYGGRYVWTHGYYAAPPRPGAAWIPGRWVPRGGGWYYIRGHWRY